MAEVINTMRHESVFSSAEHDYPVHIIGAGATGSRIFAALIELGIRQISVYDPDTIEEHNLANQIYNTEDIGMSKTAGCYKFARRKLGIPDEQALPAGLNFTAERVTKQMIQRGSSPFRNGGVVFILTDTMASRREIFDALIEQAGVPAINQLSSGNRETPLVIIETRMGSTHGSIFTINPFDRQACEQWRSTLVDDTDPDNIELSPCGTTLSVGTTASLIANYAVWQMMQFFVDPVGMTPRLDLFFKPTLTITSPAIAA